MHDGHSDSNCKGEEHEVRWLEKKVLLLESKLIFINAHSQTFEVGKC